EPLTFVIDDNGRGGRAGPFERLDVAHVHMLGTQAGTDGVAGIVVADATPKLGRAAQARDGHRGVGGHSAAGLEVLEPAHLGRLWRESLDAVDAIEGRMSDTDDVLRRCHASRRLT